MVAVSRTEVATFVRSGWFLRPSPHPPHPPFPRYAPDHPPGVGVVFIRGTTGRHPPNSPRLRPAFILPFGESIGAFYSPDPITIYPAFAVNGPASPATTRPVPPLGLH